MNLLSKFIEQQRQYKITPYLNGHVLDLGCGFGAVIRYHNLNPDSYVGVDQNPTIINWLRVNFPQYRIEQRDLDFDLLNFNEKFDTIVMTAVLEHLKKPSSLFEQIPNLLTKEGVVVITTPTPFGGEIHKFGSSVGLFYREAANDHERFYNKQDLHSILRTHGLRPIYFKRFLMGGNQILVGRLI